MQRSRPDWARSLSRYGLAPPLSTEPPAEYLPFGPKGRREEQRVEEMWERTTQILERFRDDVRNRGAHLSVFYVPARFEANDEAWTFLRRRYEDDRPWARDAVRLRLTGVLGALAIPLVDTTTAFRAAERTRNRAYLAVDGHWNGHGNEIAFEGVLPMMRNTLACG
jgi:hypothetical protein